MGVDCQIHLYPTADLDDIGKVIIALAGDPVVRHDFDNHDGYYTRAGQDAEWKAQTFSRGMYSLTFEAKTRNGDEWGNVSAWLQTSDARIPGMIMMIPRSTAWWIAVGKKLVGTFGGFLTYADTGSMEPDYARWPKPIMAATNGDDWQERQDILLAIKPLTRAEIEAETKHAAYK